MSVGGASPLCPVCHSRGVYSILMSLECRNGMIKNLCSSTACSYPFSRYESTKISVSKVAVATEEVDNPHCLDDFLNEILGTSSDNHELTTAISTPITQPHFSAPDFINNLDSRSELSGGTSYKCSSSLFSTNHCGPDSVRGKNCLLPRYLVDNLTLGEFVFDGRVQFITVASACLQRCTVSKVAVATEEVDNPHCLDDFLNEILGTSSDNHELTTAISTPITQPHFSAPDFINNLDSRSELSGATADRDCNRYGSKPASRLPGGSCDSGISVSSTASPCSPSFTYEEHLKHFNHQSSPTSLSEHPTVVSPTAPRHTASTRKVTRHMSVVDRIIHSRRSLQ
ncbi:hypothetical protein T265_00401 [Opisthorchis viverrini]|uniref:Uncharacterized protein n=1 Tax=Opisthorchis viverrini TaxID=6198 RepID=A0A075A1Y9_OPIVI|nr:hypothetical protein T265_00401 [Opisthorchis viverrini]KER33713.1 hypothetical protein T265_00401 [Opisthorchis viverrini]